MPGIFMHYKNYKDIIYQVHIILYIVKLHVFVNMCCIPVLYTCIGYDFVVKCFV